MKELFNTVLYEPLYNALIGLIDIIPGGDVGLAVIVLTIFVKLVLFPLSKKAVYTQIKMKAIQPELDAMKEKYKDKREEMGRAMLDLYKREKINPFSSIVVVFIQIPVILALYFVFLRGGLPSINLDILYSFVPVPENVNVNFLGFIDISAAKSALVAILVAVTQHIQARLSFPVVPVKTSSDGKPNFKDDMMRGMGIQMKWVLPVVFFFISYTLITVVGLYWFVSNLFTIGQEMYMRKKVRAPLEQEIEDNKKKEGVVSK